MLYFDFKEPVNFYKDIIFPLYQVEYDIISKHTVRYQVWESTHNC